MTTANRKLAHSYTQHLKKRIPRARVPDLTRILTHARAYDRHVFPSSKAELLYFQGSV